MTTASSTAVTRREPELLGQTVVIIGGSAGIGLETARQARAEGAEVILAARVNLIAPGFVDTPLSASLLGDDSKRAGLSSAPRSRSAAWSGRPTWPPSPSTS